MADIAARLSMALAHRCCCPAGRALREAVKATIENGLEAAGALYGARPETFRDVVYRQRPP